jgi:Cu+-exporting ATPase
VRLAAALASHSAHPISQAIARLSPDRPAVADWQEIRGTGVQAKVEPDDQSPVTGHQSSVTAQLGSILWLEKSGVDLTPGQMFLEEWASQGATVVGLAVEKSLRGLFAVKDAVKPGARDVVQQLELQGLKVYLVTGDNALTAASIAQQTGIPPANVFAQVRPEQKAEFVKKLQQQGHRVAFVGDGINDAPALEQADLGVAVSRASDVAREAADIILLKSEIEAVPESLGLARATLRTIKQNLFWAFFYNAISVPLAALGFMSPILCAAAMGLSDLVVIGNALRLRRWRAS